MAEIKWTAEAESWLSEMFEYIAQGNPVAARNVAQSFLSKFNSYKTFKKSGINTKQKKKATLEFCSMAIKELLI